MIRTILILVLLTANGWGQYVEFININPKTEVLKRICIGCNREIMVSNWRYSNLSEDELLYMFVGSSQCICGDCYSKAIIRLIREQLKYTLQIGVSTNIYISTSSVSDDDTK